MEQLVPPDWQEEKSGRDRQPKLRALPHISLPETTCTFQNGRKVLSNDQRRTTVNWLANMTTGLKSLFDKQRVECELDEELESYLEASSAHKHSIGMTPDAARRAALVEMGSRNSIKHRVWSSRWESTLDTLARDVR